MVRSTRGARYTAVRPTLSDFILKMPRGAQVIYPKDLGPILMLADMFPGARVFESGVGSGALSMAMLRAGADVTGYELREDFADRARANVASFLGADALDRYHVEIRDAYDGIDETGFDRVVLDLPEPWRVVQGGRDGLAPGGILVAYTPSITQASSCRDALDAAPSPWPRPSRSSSAAGTSKASRCDPTTAWWPTPASSPRPACWAPTNLDGAFPIGLVEAVALPSRSRAASRSRPSRSRPSRNHSRSRPAASRPGPDEPAEL